MNERSAIGKRRVTGTIALSLDAWTALDLMAHEDHLAVSAIVQRLVVDEAKRRMETAASLSAPQVEPVPASVPKARRSPRLTDAERERRRERMRGVWAAKRKSESVPERAH